MASPTAGGSPMSPSSALAAATSVETKEAALIDAATIILRSLPPTYPVFTHAPPPNSVLDTNPMTVGGQLSALFSIAANTARKLTNLNNQFLSPLIGSASYDRSNNNADADDRDKFNYLGMTSTFAGGTHVLAGGGGADGGSSSSSPSYGLALKPHILAYHYRNSTVIPIDPIISKIIYGEDEYVKRTHFFTVNANANNGARNNNNAVGSPTAAMVASSSLSFSSSNHHGSEKNPPIGLLLSPNTQLIQRMRRCSVLMSSSSTSNNQPLSVFAAEAFLNAIQIGEEEGEREDGEEEEEGLSLVVQHLHHHHHTQTKINEEENGTNANTKKVRIITNIFTKPMAKGDIRLTGIDVTHLFVLPPCPYSSSAASSSSTKYSFIAEVDMIDCEIIRVWRVSCASNSNDHAISSSSSSLSSSLSSRMHQLLVAAANHDDVSIALYRTVWKWTVGETTADGEKDDNATDPAAAGGGRKGLPLPLSSSSTTTRALGNAKVIGISVGERVLAKGSAASVKYVPPSFSSLCPCLSSLSSSSVSASSPHELYSVNIAAQQWSDNGMSAVTYRYGLAVEGVTAVAAATQEEKGKGDIKEFAFVPVLVLTAAQAKQLENAETAAAATAALAAAKHQQHASSASLSTSPSASLLPSIPSIYATIPLIAAHFDTWLLIADHDWVPNTDVCKTHVGNSLTVGEAEGVAGRWRERMKYLMSSLVGSNAEEEAAGKRKNEQKLLPLLLPTLLDALHLNTIRACEDKMCNEQDAKHVWLQYLRCQLPPSKNLLVFNESTPPQRPAFAKKV